MSLTATVTPVKQLNLLELVTSAKLNQMSWITIAIAGTSETADLADRSVTAAKAENFGAWFEGTDSGTANAHAVAITSGLSAPVTGTTVFYKVNATNTNATVKIDVTASVGGAWTQADIKRSDGQNPAIGELKSGSYLLLRYDGTNFQILSVSHIPASRYVTSTGSTNAYVLTFGLTTGYPTASALTEIEGRPIYFKANFANGSACTLNIDGLGAKAIRLYDDAALTGGEIKQDQVVGVVYDSTLDHFLMITPPAAINQAAVVGASNNVRITHSAGTTVDLDADDIIVTDNNNQPKLLQSINSTLDSTTTGLDALDQGTIATGWYYIWAVYNGTTSGGLLSTSSSAPSDSNYAFTHKALVGVVYYTGSAFAAYAERINGRWHFTSEDLTPDSGTAATDHTVSHPFGRLPTQVRTVIECVTNEDGFLAGEELDAGFVQWSTGSQYVNGLRDRSTSSSVIVTQIDGFTGAAGGVFYYPAQTIQYPTAANWKIKVYAQF